MKVRQLISYIFVGIITIVITLSLSLKNETVFIDYTRKHNKRTHGHYFDITLDKIVTYPLPNFTKIKKIIFSQPRKGLYRIKIETYAPIPPITKDRLSFSVYFDTPTVEGLWDTGIIYAHGPYPFPHTPPSPKGGIFYSYKKLWIGKIKASARNATVTIDFESRLVDNSTDLQMVVVRYLPANVEISRVSGGIQACHTDVVRLDPSLKEVQIMIPDHP